jgi:hypothetical protein
MEKGEGQGKDCQHRIPSEQSKIIYFLNVLNGPDSVDWLG